MRLFIMLILIVFVCGCDTGSASTAAIEQKKTEENQYRLLKSQPPVQIAWSLEREQINKRTKRWNDENKVSYIYLTTEYGQIMTFMAIKGKVSSVNSQITNPSQVLRTSKNGNVSYNVMPSPAEDGSYGSNGDAIYFFTTEDVYVEWNGKYLLLDQPLQMSSVPNLVYVQKEEK